MTSTDGAMETERSRRHRENTNVDATEGEAFPASKRHQSDASPSKISREEPNVSPSSYLASPPPKYGSKVYWDDRYKKQFRQVSNVSSSSPSSETETESTMMSNPDDEHKDTLPYHSWYFTYDELRPILLPLLLGGREEVQALLASQEGPEEVEGFEDVAFEGTTHEPIDTVRTISDHDLPEDKSASDNEVDSDVDEEEEDSEDEVWEEVVEVEEEEDALPQRDGLAKAGPVAILEIGCGDVPLGAALALEFKELETTNNINEDYDGPPLTSLSIVSKIVCTDYSQVVVDMMRHQYRSMCCGSIGVSLLTRRENKVPDDNLESLQVINVGSVPLQFEVTDARKLPYGDSSFHLVLEKGALDAVLSDTVSGVADCVQIVAECARVTSGCVVLISHLNAHTPSGLSWLEEVVFAGLRKSPSRNIAWEVEVHGNADVTPAEDEEDPSVSRIPSGTPGPAVYIIHKKTTPPSEPNTDDGAAARKSPINVQFFSYQ
jgi:hypothetical protein